MSAENPAVAGRRYSNCCHYILQDSIGGIEGRTLAAGRALSAVWGLVWRAAHVQEPTGGSTTLAHQLQNFFAGETRIDARHVQR
jgi:hypothetical protein